MTKMYIQYNIQIGNFRNPQPTSLTIQFNPYLVMFELEKYINKVQKYGLVMPPGHVILKNTSHINMTFTHIKKYNSKSNQYFSADGSHKKYSNVNNNPF